MDYSDQLIDRQVNEEALRAYGFQKGDKDWRYRKPTQSDPSFAFEVRYEPGVLQLNLRDSTTGEIYPPFSVEGAHGSYVAAFREEGNRLLSDILLHCFESNSLREKLIVYLRDTDQAEITHAWPHQFPHYVTIHEKNNPKWYGLIMNVPYQKLGIDKKGEVQVLNVKLDPSEIQKRIDHQTYFPAYHMNKTDWISILLTTSISFEEVVEQVEKSHLLCSKKKESSHRK
jgi:predicted DNA-binding protein (MmcQ/YjbR family)